MADDLNYPGLVGAGISPQPRSPYNRSFESGEATIGDVQNALLEVLLSAFAGRPITPGRTSTSAGGRVRRQPGTPIRVLNQAADIAGARRGEDRLGRGNIPFKSLRPEQMTIQEMNKALEGK